MTRRLNVVVAALAVSAGLAVLGGLIWYLQQPDSAPDTTADSPLGVSATSGGVKMASLSVGREPYVRSSACQDCHAEEYSSWHDSYHRTMTQWATPQTVVAPFDVTLEARGRTYQLEQRGDEYWVTMLEPELDKLVSQRGVANEDVASLPTVAQKVVMTTGSHVAQTYWVETENSIQHMPWMYHIEQQKWIPNEDSFLFPPTDRRFFSEWNVLCAKCHSVAHMPGKTDAGYQTRVAELGIACEACHGPGQQHIQFHRQKTDGLLSGGAVSLTRDPIVNPARLPHDLASQVCAQCHSNYRESDIADWVVNGSDFRPGQDLEKQVTMHRYGLLETRQDYGDGHWHDGTARTGGDEYLGMVQSACYLKGEMSCLSCHSLHEYESTTDQLKPGHRGNESCLNCHESMQESLTAHTHHAADSSGSQCVNCHMPHITYALFKGIRSHRIDSPDVTITAKTGRPNACNLCHVDQSLGWTETYLSQWYGQPAAELSPTDRELSSAMHLALTGDASQRVISAWNMGWPSATETAGNTFQAAALAQLLDDPYSVVRYVSYLSLKKMPGFEEFEYDFLDPPLQRQEAVQRALEIFRQQGVETGRQENAGVLLGKDGQLQAEVMAELLKQRDDTPIVIAE